MNPRPNAPSGRSDIFWARLGNSTAIQKVRRQIESKAKALEYRELNLRAMRGRDDLLAKSIFRCTPVDPCAEVLCPSCARRYRLWLTSMLLDLAAQGTPAFIATILLEAVRGPALKKVEPGVLHERVRKRLIRAGVKAAIGGTEASYEAKENRWIIHLHLLVFESLERGRAKIREAFSDSNLDRAVVCQPLQDPVAQISYLQKFSTYHRPGQPGSSSRGRAYPMKPEQIGQLARWTRRFWFEDFLFVLGLRRRGERFEPENGFRQALVEARQNARARGDGGDGRKRYPRNTSATSSTPMTSVTPPNDNSDQLYRDPASKRAIRKDKKHAAGSSIPSTRSSTVATNSTGAALRSRRGERDHPRSKSSYRTERE
jgi:hypothetical protein